MSPPSVLPMEPAARLECLAADHPAHLAEFHGISIEEAKARMARGGQIMAQEWAAGQPGPGEVAGFYRQTKSYVYELAEFSGPDRLGYLEEIHSLYLNRGDDFLDFGAGCGDLGLMFAGVCRVCSLDVPGETQAYAEFRAHKYGQPMVFLGHIPSDRDFAVISAQDVLEHLEDPYTHVERMAAAIKPGGYLITSGFWFNPEMPLHLRENACYKNTFVQDFSHRFDLWLEKIFARPTGPNSFAIGVFRKKKPKYPVMGIEYHTRQSSLRRVPEECLPTYTCRVPASDI